MTPEREGVQPPVAGWKPPAGRQGGPGLDKKAAGWAGPPSPLGWAALRLRLAPSIWEQERGVVGPHPLPPRRR